jgi:hypothetical protein
MYMIGGCVMHRGYASWVLRVERDIVVLERFCRVVVIAGVAWAPQRRSGRD